VALAIVCVLALLGSVAVWALRRARGSTSSSLKDTASSSGVREPLAGHRKRFPSIDSVEIGELPRSFTTCLRARMCVRRARAHTHTHTHLHTHTHTHTRTHARAHTHTRARAHTQTHLLLHGTPAPLQTSTRPRVSVCLQVYPRTCLTTFTSAYSHHRPWASSPCVGARRKTRHRHPPLPQVRGSTWSRSHSSPQRRACWVLC
jgi:hypothetical protein